MHIYNYGHRNTHLWTQAHAIMYTQKNTRTQLWTQIQLWTHEIIYADIQRTTHTKWGMHIPIYKSTHKKSTQKGTWNAYTLIHGHQTRGPYSPIHPSTFASAKPLWEHRHSHGLLSSHAHHLFPNPLHKAVHVSLSPSIFIFLLHRTWLAGQDRKRTFLFLEPQARAKRDEGM